MAFSLDLSDTHYPTTLAYSVPQRCKVPNHSHTRSHSLSLSLSLSFSLSSHPLIALRTPNEREAPDDALASISDAIRERMSGRGFAVGSNEVTAPLIERDFRCGIALLEAHLVGGQGGLGAGRPYLFGGRPSFADFGLGAQIYQALIDPTAGEHIRSTAPRVAEWATRMLSPVALGAFEEWEALRDTLEPFLGSCVRSFLAWSAANTEALDRGDKELVVYIDSLGGGSGGGGSGGGSGGEWRQALGGPQKYQRKSLKVLRDKFRRRREAALGTDTQDGARLDDVLGRCGCLGFLTRAPPSKL